MQDPLFDDLSLDNDYAIPPSNPAPANQPDQLYQTLQVFKYIPGIGGALAKEASDSIDRQKLPRIPRRSSSRGYW